MLLLTYREKVIDYLPLHILFFAVYKIEIFTLGRTIHKRIKAFARDIADCGMRLKKTIVRYNRY